MAVTIAGQAEVIVAVFPQGQLTAPAPLFEGIVVRFLAGHEPIAPAVDFERLTGIQAKLLSRFPRNG